MKDFMVTTETKTYKNKQSTRPTGIADRLLCIIIVFVMLVALGGCSTVFADNPVIQTMESTNGKLDLSKFDSNVISKKPDDEDSSTSVSNEEAKIFIDFIAKIKTSSSVSYTRGFTYSENPPEATDELNKFLTSSNIEVFEQNNLIAMDNKNNGDKLVYDGSSAVIKKISSNDSIPVDLTNKEKRHTLNFLASEARLEILTVEDNVMVDNVEYFVINLKENSQISKWYFDAEGDLTLRMYLEGEDLYAVKYHNIIFDVPIDPSTFLIEKEKGIEEGIDTLESEELPEPIIVEEPEVVTPPPKEQETKAESTVSEEVPKKAEVSKIEPVEPEVEKPQPQEVETKAPAPIKKEEVVTQPVQQQVIKIETEPKPKEPLIGTVLPGAKEETTATKPSDPTKIIEYTPEKQAASNVPGNITDYPSSALPIMKSLNVSSAEDNTKNNVRKIEVYGDYTNSIDSAASYYEEILKSSSNYNKKEKYDEKTGTSHYMLRGKVDGWNIYIDIKEENQDKKMNIILEK